MVQSVFLTQDAFDALLANLLEIEEGMFRIMEDFFPEPTKEADEVKRLLNDYVGKIGETITKVTVRETANNDFPYVIVGSEVVVEDIESHKTYQYKIISPNKTKISISEISFLSPMGKALLLKKAGDYFAVEAPGGVFSYKVLSVKIPAEQKTARLSFKWMKGDS